VAAEDRLWFAFCVTGKRKGGVAMKVVSKCFRKQRIFIVMMVVMPLVSSIFMGCPFGGTGGPNVPGTSANASGVIMVPANPAPYALQVDGSPMSMNADLSTGNWEWYKFGGEAGKKYYIYATGNAPINLILFQGIPNEEEEEEMAVMLWTTESG